MYSDVGLFTCNPDLVADATSVFNAICGYSQPQKLRKLALAPIGLRDRLLELIDGEIARKREGQEAHIMAQINSLADPQIIDALYDASQAGVKIELNVRGICCLRPGVRGLSSNISAVSIPTDTLNTDASSTSFMGAKSWFFYPALTGCRVT